MLIFENTDRQSTEKKKKKMASRKTLRSWKLKNLKQENEKLAQEVKKLMLEKRLYTDPFIQGMIPLSIYKIWFIL